MQCLILVQVYRSIRIQRDSLIGNSRLVDVDRADRALVPALIAVLRVESGAVGRVNHRVAALIIDSPDTNGLAIERIESRNFK